jgi:hypothetical protein
MKFFLKCFLTQKRLLFSNTSRKTSGKLQRWSVLDSSPTLQGGLKSRWRVCQFFKIINFHQSAGCPLQAASVRFQQQLPCSRHCVNELQPAATAQTKEVEVGTSLYMFGIPCVIKTHPAWFRLSLISISWLAFPSHHQIELLQNPGRIHRTSGGSVWVGGSSGDNAISISKARCDFKWSVLLCKIRSDFWTTKPSQKLHEVPKWRVFWRIENKKQP